MSSRVAYLSLDDDLIGALNPASITIYDEDLDYPKTCLQSIPMADVARATEPSGGVKIHIDFGVNVSPTTHVFLNHNIISGNWTVRTYNDAFATPSGETLAVAYRRLDTWASRQWTPKRYWEYDFFGCTFNDAFWEMGKILAGNLTVIGRQFAPGLKWKSSYFNIRNTTPRGIRWTYIMSDEPQKSLSVIWTHLDDVLDDLLGLKYKTKGGGYPFVFSPDYKTDELYYFWTEDESAWDELHARKLISGFILNLIEDARGKGQLS